MLRLLGSRSNTKWAYQARALCSAQSFKGQRKVFLSLGGLGIVFVGYSVSNEQRRRSLVSGGKSVFRIFSLVGTAGVISVDYGIVMLKNVGVRSEQDIVADELQQSNTEFEKLITLRELGNNPPYTDIENARKRVEQAGVRMAELMSDPRSSPFHDVHRRCAIRLRKLCERNKGIYIKLGQHLGQLDYLLPPEYIDELKTLFANNPVSATETIYRVIQEETGSSADKIWASFDEQPIASASLAQVHVATDDNGFKYAVKVQHEGLLEASQADLKAITLVAGVISWLFKDFDYDWLVKEINHNLPRELDFRLEAQNAIRAKEFLFSDSVVIPDVFIATPRLLSMRFEEGCYVTNKEAMRKLNIQNADVARLISETFSDQTFKHGFVHCDPHVGNLLIRQHPLHPDKPQLVLLDHGLYRELSDNFRRSYARLWGALISSDVHDIKRYCEELNAGDVYPLMASILTFKSWDDVTSNDLGRLQSKGSKSETEVLRGYAHKYFGEIVKILGSVPADLLLVLKTNDCLRHIDKELGAPINSAVVIARTVSEVILREDLHDAVSVSDFVFAWFKYFKIRFRYSAFSIFSWGISLWNSFKNHYDRM